MLGVNREISAAETFFEFLRIESIPGTLVYEAAPRGGPATRFPLIQAEAGRVVFANPNHDFPQQITYWIDASGGLNAEISGLRNGTKATARWTWRPVTSRTEGPAIDPS